MKKSTAIAVLAASALGAVAVTGAALAMSAGRPDPENRPARDRYACFDPGQIRSFQSAGNRKMVVVSNWNQAYELTLTPACMGLDTSFQIGIRSRGGGMSDVCGPLDAEIVYSEMGDDRLQTCTVQDVRHLSPEEAAEYGVRPRASDNN